MSWIIGLFLLLLSLFILSRMSLFRDGELSLTHLLFAYLTKVTVGFAFLWVYTNYYTNRAEADVYKYFDDGVILYEVSKTEPGDFFHLLTGFGDIPSLTEKHLSQTLFWDRSPSLPFLNDNRFIIRFNALVHFISGGNIYIHMLFAIFCSFLGLTYLYTFLRNFMPSKHFWLFPIVFFLPSILFWTSSILKESFLIFGLGGLLLSVLKVREHPIRSIFLMAFFGIIIVLSKVYVLLCIIPPILAWMWSENKYDGKNIWRYFSMNFFFVALLLSSSSFTKFNLMETLALKQAEFKCLAEWMGAGSLVYIPDLNAHFFSFIEAAPFAIFNTLFRPLPWDKLNALSFISMIEISMIVLSLMLCLVHPRKISPEQKNILLFSANFILLLSLLIGWTTPVMGAIVRYRIVLLPFILLFPLLLLNREKLGKFAPSKMKEK